MSFLQKFIVRTRQQKKEALLNAWEMERFYNLPLEERQAVLQRLSRGFSKTEEQDSH